MAGRCPKCGKHVEFLGKYCPWCLEWLETELNWKENHRSEIVKSMIYKRETYTSQRAIICGLFSFVIFLGIWDFTGYNAFSLWIGFSVLALIIFAIRSVQKFPYPPNTNRNALKWAHLFYSIVVKTEY